MQRLQWVTGISLTLALLLAGCAPATETPAAPAATAAPATPKPTTSTPATPTSWQADGVVSAGEYAHQTTIGDVQVWWSNDAQSLYLAMEAPTTGWVAVGIDPEMRMQGANFVFGAVVDGQAQVWDAYGTGPTGPHPADEELGGTNDIAAYAGVEENGVTRFEVQIPLDSGDQYDKSLEPGQTYTVIAAMGSADDFNAHHVSRAAGEITLDQ